MPISGGMPPEKLLFMRRRLWRNVRFVMEEEMEPDKLCESSWMEITLPGCILLHEIPVQSQKGLLSFHDWKTPKGSSVIPAMNLSSATLSVWIPGKNAASVGRCIKHRWKESRGESKDNQDMDRNIVWIRSIVCSLLEGRKGLCYYLLVIKLYNKRNGTHFWPYDSLAKYEQELNFFWQRSPRAKYEQELNVICIQTRLAATSIARKQRLEDDLFYFYFLAFMWYSLYSSVSVFILFCIFVF